MPLRDVRAGLGAIAGLGMVLWFFRDRNHQGFHDKLAKTLVVADAEGVVQAKWERTNAFLARTHVRMRALSSSAP